PSEVGPPRLDSQQPLREEHLADGKELLIHSMPFFDRRGNKYVLEAGAPHEQIERVLYGLLLSLGIAFPLIVAVASGGCNFVMRNALKPLDEIASPTQRLNLLTLNERVTMLVTR